MGGAAAEDMVLQLAATKLTVSFEAAISHNCVVLFAREASRVQLQDNAIVFGRGRAGPAIAASLQWSGGTDVFWSWSVMKVPHTVRT